MRVFGVVWHTPLIVMALCFTGVLFGVPYGVEAMIWGVGDLPGTLVMEFALLFSVIGLAVTWALGLFSRRQRASIAGLGMRAFAGALCAGLVTYLISRMTGLGEMGGRTILLVTLLSAVIASIAVAIVSRFTGDDIFRRKVLVYGCGVRAQSIAALRRRADRRGFKIAGFLQPVEEAIEVPADKVLAPKESLLALALECEIDEIVIAMDDRRRNFPIAELLDCRLAGIEITDLMSFLERETGKVHLEVLNPSWLIFGDGFRRDAVRRYSERIFDVIASSLLLVLAAPVMLLTALAIVIESGFPVFYRQKRVGFRGRCFDVIKFRSMRVDAEKNGAVWAKAGDTRVTAVGAVIRKLRIDELPQILNVMRGDMAFVGPRPERPEFVAQLSETIPYYSERHWVKPGITGWAQLCYPYGASERDALEKLQYDLYYVKNHSLLFDIMVLAQTAEVVLLGKGAR
jgi:sugar transferase (PEP-CTERM system associated)